MQADGAASLVRAAIEKIPQNYDFSPVLYQAHLIDRAYQGDENVWYEEHLFEFRTEKSKVKIRRGNSRTQVLDPQFGNRKGFLISLGSSKQFFLQDYQPDFLRLKRMNAFQYQLEDITVDGADTLYIIKIQEKGLRQEPRYHLVHIDKQRLAFRFVRYYFNLRGKEYTFVDSYYEPYQAK